MTAPQNVVTDPSDLDYGKSPQELAAQSAAVANGVQLTERIRHDYWSNEETFKFYFPGQEDLNEEDKQYIEYKKMNEGMRTRFQKVTNKGVVIERASNNARMGMDPAGDRQALIEISVTGWNLFRNGDPLKYSGANLHIFIQQADPYLVDKLEEAIRKHNPWMAAQISSEEIRTQIKDLEEQYTAAKEREEEEKNS